MLACAVKAAQAAASAPRPGPCRCTGGGCCSCAGGCCRGCTGQARPDAPDQPDRPRPAKNCPCAGRDTTLPSGVEQDSPGLPPAPVPSLPLAAEALAGSARAAPAFTSLPPPPRLLNCLWLC
jgi:hypothetical protein